MSRLVELLNLEKPLVLLDLETTGPNPAKDEIVQIGLIKLYPDGQENRWKTLVRPNISIPPDVTEVHGITDEMVSHAPPFEKVAGVLLKGLSGCYLGGYNVHFDVDCLDHSFWRIRAPFDPDDFELLDAFDIFKHFHPRNLAAAYRHYVGKELSAAHQADIDIGATKEVLEAQFDTHPELPRNISEIVALVQKPRGNRIDRRGKLLWREDGQAILNFGKHSGELLSKIPHKYLKWMAYEADDFSPKVRRIAIAAMKGEYPERKDP